MKTPDLKAMMDAVRARSTQAMTQLRSAARPRYQLAARVAAAGIVTAAVAVATRRVARGHATQRY